MNTGSLNREQTTIRLPADLKQQIQRKADRMEVKTKSFVGIQDCE